MKPLQIITLATLCIACSANPDEDTAVAEVEKLLKIQEQAYDERSEENIQKLLATCDENLIFVGGDDGGMLTNAKAYVSDLADGYTIKPYDYQFKVDGSTVIVTSKHQAFKLLGADTLFLNARSTKIFVKKTGGWKMTYVTYAPLAILYFSYVRKQPEVFRDYAGIYDLGNNLLDSVYLEGTRVLSSVDGSGGSEIFPINDSTFTGDGYFGRVIFGRNAKGTVTHYTFEWNDGQRIRFNKVR